ncbi:MAG: TolC family protein, partial [Ignavibacteria bacterium]|nr:TolC family protein [Ignavibacteria bacterium]
MKKINFYFLLISVLCVNQIYAQKVLTLAESKQLALQNNAKSKNSKLEVEASHQVKKSAFTNYFPSISGGGMMFEAQKGLMEIETQGGNLPVYDGNLANLSSATLYAYMPASTMSAMKKGTVGFINVVQPVFAGGRIYNGNKLASLSEEVSGFKEKMTQDEILLKTEEQYWQIVSLEEKSKTVNRFEALLKRLLNQVEDAFKSGLVMKNDVLKVKLKLNEVLLNKSKLENGRKLAAMAFCQHLGIPFDSQIVLKDELHVRGIPQNFYVENSEALKNRNEYNLLGLSVEAEK